MVNAHEPDAGLERQLQDFVKERIAPYKYPRRIVFVAELPKTATGKIQRFKLREKAGALESSRGERGLDSLT